MDTVSQNFKKCIVCETDKPLSRFKKGKWQYENKCLDCRAPDRRRLARRRPGERKCSVCEMWKPDAEFGPKKDNRDGIAFRCNPCMAEKSHRAYQADPATWLLREKNRYLADPSKKKAAAIRYRAENLDAARAGSRERNRKYYRENPEQRAAYTHDRRARERSAPGHFTGSEFRELCIKYGNRCLRCGAQPEKLSADHVIPLSRGGANSIDNIQPLCLTCNLSKSTKATDYRMGAQDTTINV